MTAETELKIAIEDPTQPEIIVLLRDGEQHSAKLYPAESNHHMPLSALCASNVRFLDLALTAIGFLCSPSQANFLLATVPAGGRWHSAEKVYRSLMARRIFVRWFNEEGSRDKLRISIGTPEENQHLVEALRLMAREPEKSQKFSTM